MSILGLLGLPGLQRLASAAPVVARVLVGVVMAAHGWEKLTDMTPAGFGEGMLEGLGVPAPVFFGWVVTLVELVGALLLVKVDIGLLAPMGADMPGAELEFGLLAGLVTVLLLGPGRPSLDHALAIETTAPRAVDTHRAA